MGFRKGLIIEVASLLALILGVYGAIKFSFYISLHLTHYVDWSPEFIHMASLVLTFMGIVLGVHLIARGIQGIVKMAALGIPNRIAGAFFGGLKYLLILAIAIYAVETINNRYPFLKSEIKNKSMFYEPVASIIPLVSPTLEEYLAKHI